MSTTAKVTNTVLVPVHRLDMDTSGLLVYAKTDRGTKALMAAFREGRVEKRYRALLEKRLPDALGTEGEVRFPITTNPLDRLRQCAAVGGREASRVGRFWERAQNARSWKWSPSRAARTSCGSTPRTRWG